MKSLWKYLVQSALAVGVSASVPVMIFAQDVEQAGVVRISKPRTSEDPNRVVIRASSMMMDGACAPSTASPGDPMSCDPSLAGQDFGPAGACDGSMGMCNQGGNCGHRKYSRQDWRYSDWQGGNCWGSGLHRRTQAHSLAFDRKFRCATGLGPHSVYYHDPSGQAMMDYLKCKFGYFIPTGGGGQGIPCVGCYSRVYPVDPAYSDRRDGQAWAAQGYGLPMAVPLAPVVGHTYNYSWGIPSSRLTPVSNPAY